MAWSCKSPGDWRKELGGLQKTYLLTSKSFENTTLEHWRLYSLCKVSPSGFKDFGGVLRDAWKGLRYEFPNLGVVARECDATYNADSDDSALENWARKTFVVTHSTRADDLIASYPRQDLPILFWLPTTSEVLLLISHWRIDATGCLILLNHLFVLIAEQKDVSGLRLGKQDLTRMSPSMEDAIGAPETSSPEILEKSKDFLVNFQKKTTNTIGFDYQGDNNLAPKQPAHLVMSLTLKSSEALISACKKQCISISAAAYTALAMTMFALGKQKDVTEYATIMAVNIRPYLQSPFNTSTHPCQPYVSSITPSVSKSAAFTESASSLTQYFKTWHTPDFNTILRQVYKTISGALLNPPRNVPVPSNLPSGITLSSLGIIEHNMKSSFDDKGSIEIENFRFGVNILNRQMLLYIWTFDGKIHLSVNYNEAYYDCCTPQSLLNSIKDVLGRELGVDLECD